MGQIESSSFPITKFPSQTKDSDDVFVDWNASFSPIRILTPQLKTKINNETEFIVKQDKPNDAEITLLLDDNNLINKVLALLTSYKVDVIATSEYITQNKRGIYIWLNDIGSAVKNAVNCRLFGNEVSILPKLKPRGTKSLVFLNAMTTKEFVNVLKVRFNQDKQFFIAHSPITNTGSHCIYF